MLLGVLGGCTITPPKIAVATVDRTLADAIRSGKKAGVKTVTVVVAVAYVIKGGVEIPVALVSESLDGA